MANRLAGLIAALTLVAASLAGGDAVAAALSVELTGTGTGGQPLQALVLIEIADPSLAVLHVKNTSPPTAADAGEPALTSLGFSLANGPPAECLSVVAPGWVMGGGISPFCGPGNLTGGPAAITGFPYRIDAVATRTDQGLAPDFAVDIQLRVTAACAGSFAFTPETFVNAPPVPSQGKLAQWVGKFGAWGCAEGLFDGLPGKCRPRFTWSEFIATAATVDGFPSDYYPSDRRAGSVEYNFNGQVGMNGVTTDPPFEAAILTIRNGHADLLEQWHLNRVWAPLEGCDEGGVFPVCWLYAPTAVVDGSLSAYTPVFAGSSNDGFDDSGLRPEVSGHLHVSYASAQKPQDNSHETLVVVWTAPLGLDQSQLLLRGRYDANLDGLDPADPMITLLRRNFSTATDVLAPQVSVVSQTGTSLVVAVNVQTALERVCQVYRTTGGLTPPPPGGQATTTGAPPATNRH